MPSERASLATVEIPDLSNLHQPLSSRRTRDRVEAAPESASESTNGVPERPVTVQKERTKNPPSDQAREETQPAGGASAYPSLSASPREHLIPYSIRLPISQIDALDKLCRSRNIDKSNLVRDFIAAGLKTLGDELASLR